MDNWPTTIKTLHNKSTYILLDGIDSNNPKVKLKSELILSV